MPSTKYALSLLLLGETEKRQDISVRLHGLAEICTRELPCIKRVCYLFEGSGNTRHNTTRRTHTHIHTRARARGIRMLFFLLGHAFYVHLIKALYRITATL